jgi:lipopolysaccharide export system permease protein
LSIDKLTFTEDIWVLLTFKFQFSIPNFSRMSTLTPSTPFSWNRLRFGVPIMDRYIISELIAPFLFCVGAFSSIGVAIGVLFDLSRKIADAGLPPTIALKVLLLKLPYFISFSFPISLLIACLFIYDQLSSNSEIIALRSCGVSIWRLVVPAVLLSLFITGVTFVFNEAVVPAANRQATQTLDRALKGNEPKFQEQDILYQEFDARLSSKGEPVKGLSRLFYAKEFDGKEMKGLTVLDFSQNKLNQIIMAKTGVWNSQQNTWEFFDGTIYVVDNEAKYRNIVTFARQQFQLPRAPLDLAQATTDPIEMNMADIRKYLRTVGISGNQKEVTRLKLRLEQKVSFPFICPMFGLVGAALGIRSQRSGKRAIRFLLGLLIILFYFLFTQICDTLYLLDILSPVVAAWLPNIVILGAGIGLVVRHSR